MEKSEIKAIIKKVSQAELQHGKYGNGSDCPFRRIIEDGMEYTLIGAENEKKYLYMGEEGATVSRLKEGRREDNLVINGEKAKWAALIANNIVSENDFFKTC